MQKNHWYRLSTVSESTISCIQKISHRNKRSFNCYEHKLLSVPIFLGRLELRCVHRKTLMDISTNLSLT